MLNIVKKVKKIMLNIVKKVKKIVIILKKKSEVEQNVYMENEEENKNEGD